MIIGHTASQLTKAPYAWCDSISATPSTWGAFSSSITEYSTASTVLSLVWPDLFHLVSHNPRILILYARLYLPVCLVHGPHVPPFGI